MVQYTPYILLTKMLVLLARKKGKCHFAPLVKILNGPRWSRYLKKFALISFINKVKT